MTHPAAFCATCLAPLRDGTARATDRGYICDRDDCSTITRKLGEALITPADKDAIVNAYLDGATISEVRVITGRARETIVKVLNERNIERRHGGRRPRTPRAEYDEAELRYDGGWVKQGLIWKPTRKDVA